ncbi:RAQPRD family integrative conjugative element protein [uncultured Cardiobacterium sp.]|uniref:RAQPRD family integrative conjugative element protein n=1 Tax=uncultured Cardiobacterium sp. TaxID=417619 RepID=UPI00260181B1|nr:RAQPRD family integrative conjugative element protein [uncultured Cardiobacterium sp.]
MSKSSPPTKSSSRVCSRRTGITALLSVCAALLPLNVMADEADMPPPQKVPKKRKAKPVAQPQRSEQAEIESLLREMEFLRERAQSLQGRYGRSGNGKIRFNYDALIAQMRTTEAGIRDYLNARIDVIHTTPPPTVGGSLIRVRPN